MKDREKESNSMEKNQAARSTLSPDARRALSALEQNYPTPADGWFTEEGFRAKTYTHVYHPIFEELERAGYIELADVFIWKRTSYSAVPGNQP